MADSVASFATVDILPANCGIMLPMRTKKPKKAVAADTAEGLRCSFCNRDRTEVTRLVEAPAAAICDSCVGICLGILLGDAAAGDQVGFGFASSIVFGVRTRDLKEES